MNDQHASFSINRRGFLGSSAGGLGWLALRHLLAEETKSNAPSASRRTERKSPLAPKRPHHRAQAKAVICLFQHGGPSQIDLFDPKPELTKWDGKSYPGDDLEIHFNKAAGKLLASPFRFQPEQKTGIELSELIPHTARIASDITLVRSMVTTAIDHDLALRVIHTGKVEFGRPTLGSWTLYGLGSERSDLPAYVVLSDPAGLPVGKTDNWAAGWLPAIYQGTQIRSNGSPVFDLDRPEDLPLHARRNQLRFLQRLNAEALQDYPGNSELNARIRNFELAAQMQTSIGQVLDLSMETAETRKLYGLDHPNAATSNYAKRCLMARRLVEQGVPFVQIFLHRQPWDTHSNNAAQLKELTLMTDQPSAALVEDLKRRGLLDSTIVLWCGEFGRLPIAQGRDGRDHSRHGFSAWVAGGGFKRGFLHGATDQFGAHATEDIVSVHDLHATLLHALGLDHESLKYPHAGRLDSLTDAEITYAQVVGELLA